MPRPFRFCLLTSTLTLGITLAGSFPAPSPAAMGGGSMGGYGGEVSTEPAKPKPPTQSFAYRRAVKLINKADYAGAIDKLDELLQEAPTDPDVLNLLGFSHRKLGHNDQSLDYYKRALAQDPDHRGANEYLGELYLQMNDLASAQGQQKKLEALCPSGCEEREDLDKAIEAFKANKPG